MENNCGLLWALTRLLNILPFLKHTAIGISLVVQWSGLCLPIAGGANLIPGWGVTCLMVKKSEHKIETVL